MQYKNLEQLIHKKNKTHTIFLDIYNDLSKFIISTDYPIHIVLSYLHVKKFALAGLYLQGLVKSDEYIKLCNFINNFIGYNKITNYNILKNEYEKEYINFLKSYDNSLTIDIVKSLNVIVDSIIKTNTSLPKFKNDYKSIIDMVRLVIPDDYEQQKIIKKAARRKKVTKIFLIVIFIILISLLFMSLLNTGYIYIHENNLINRMNEIDI